MAALSTEQFLAIQDGRYPTLRLHADQWGEHGYFHDPIAERFFAYAIDRKEQTDDGTALADVAAVRAHAPADRRADVEAWLATLPHVDR